MINLLSDASIKSSRRRDLLQVPQGLPSLLQLYMLFTAGMTTRKVSFDLFPVRDRKLTILIG